ncbi:MAG TPA: hypothetical protein VNS32_26150 [Flavisolibacter sp.]|nr:hypothetical protein [Flavisolibacter sp.]
MANSKTIENLFLYIAQLSAALPFLFYIFNFKRARKQKGLGTIALYSFYASAINLILLLGAFPDLGLFLRSSYTLFEFLFFSYFFFSTTRSASFKKLIIFLSALFALFTVIYYLLTPVKNIDSVPIGIESILIISFSFYYLFDQLNQSKQFFIYSNYSFWIVLGFVIYLAGSFFIFLFASQSLEAIKYWYLTAIFSILKDLFFIIGMVTKPKHQSYPAQFRLLHSDL